MSLLLVCPANALAVAAMVSGGSDLDPRCLAATREGQAVLTVALGATEPVLLHKGWGDISTRVKMESGTSHSLNWYGDPLPLCSSSPRWWPKLRQPPGGDYLYQDPLPMGLEGRETGMEGKYWATFCNAHQSGLAGERSPVARCVEPWLLSILSEFDPDRDRVRKVVRHASLALDAFLSNVREHAGVSFLASASLTQVAVVRKAGGHDLVLTVIDNGAGILTTLPPKLQRHMTPPGMMKALAEGSLGYWGRARGFGLKDAVAGVLAAGGSAYFASGSEAVGVGPSGTLAESATGYKLPGTVAVARIPLGTMKGG